MVLKLREPFTDAEREFENDVKMYGTQTSLHFSTWSLSFENDVKMFKMWKSIEILWIW